MSKLVPLLAVALFTFFIFIYGACISGLVLREPDICFLLASGKWIVEHSQLPSSDPFSYSTVYHHVPYVIEKWLTEIIFYDVWKFTSTAGLLVFDAIILTLTFTVMPYRLIKLAGVRGLQALLLTFFSTLTSFCHLAVRPEIFSFLILTIYLEILTRLSQSTKTMHWPSVIALVALMVLWSNLHTLFIVGIMLLGLYAGCLGAERVLKIDSEKKMDWTVPVAFIASIPATLVTPYGFTLWQYLPNIFGPFNDTNNEMKPIPLTSSMSPFLYPFVLMCVIATIILVKHGLKKPSKSGDLFFRLLLPAGIIGGIKTVRTIPISDLFVTAGMANLLGASQRKLSTIDEKIDDLCQPFNPIWIALVTLFAGLGAYCMTIVIPPEIPTSSAAFTPPIEAIKFIGKNRPHGRMLNDPHFGNTMMWQLDNAPPVFIDSRYNLYGNTLLQDYWKMAEDKPGARELLDKYAINWIFLSPKMQLVQALSQDPQWNVLYQDSCSAIVARKKNIEEK